MFFSVFLLLNFIWWVEHWFVVSVLSSYSHCFIELLVTAQQMHWTWNRVIQINKWWCYIRMLPGPLKDAVDVWTWKRSYSMQEVNSALSKVQLVGYSQKVVRSSLSFFKCLYCRIAVLFSIYLYSHCYMTFISSRSCLELYRSPP